MSTYRVIGRKTEGMKLQCPIDGRIYYVGVDEAGNAFIRGEYWRNGKKHLRSVREGAFKTMLPVMIEDISEWEAKTLVTQKPKGHATPAPVQAPEAPAPERAELVCKVDHLSVLQALFYLRILKVATKVDVERDAVEAVIRSLDNAATQSEIESFVSSQ